MSNNVSDNEITKSFGTILTDNTHVKAQAARYKQEKKKYLKVMPKIFNPFDTWGNFLSDIKNQGKCGACFAYSICGSFNDRLAIMTLGQYFDSLSPYQMIICQGAIPPKDTMDSEYIKEINKQAHSQGACNGSSLYSSMDFLYCFGVTTTRCVNAGEFADYKIKKPEDVITDKDIPICQDILGSSYDTCLDKSVASRFYRTIAGYAVDNDVESIKQEIYKWGPVSTGFQVYNNFVRDYDGIGIYMGPAKDSKESPIGGHAVKILGWGQEKVGDEMVDFWWIENSWSTAWGRGGYCKFKMNIPECQLEQNVVAVIPDLPGFKLDYLLYKINVDQTNDFIRSWFKVEPLTGYKYSAIEKIKEGKLKGNLDNFICKYPPDFKTMWAGEMTIEDMEAFALKLNKKYGISTTYWLMIILCLIGSFYIGKGVRFFYHNKR